MAAVEAGKEIAWMRNLISEFGYSCSGASTLWSSPLKMDNQGAISVAKNPEHHGRMKHLDLENRIIAPEYVPTAEMIADNLTKAVPAPKVKYCREQMGILP